MGRGPPVIDFAPLFGKDKAAKSKLEDEIRNACLNYGSFQLRNHGIPENLRKEILRQSKVFFSLRDEVKDKYNKDVGECNRGYERLRSQNFEKLTKGDLKEGYFLAQDLPLDDSYVQARKWAQRPNKYPSEVKDPHLWKKTDPDASELERGIGAHIDFGAVTILLQDSTGGLQVRDRKTGEWVDVEPIPDAVVINTGNLMMCWTNDRYVSNLHRVVNKTGTERYSVPFFFDGNPDFLVKCLDSCIGEGGVAKHAPLTVSEWMEGRYADTFGVSKKKAAMEMVEV
ncbi:oxidoreductase [Penicillium riverlandense]|uniref:oxidoreductase n=1 Tax=Penicillium riverlandense TaxID=1903569 RepID=UPI002547ADA6|nr:oxidoreductase [Penicillium riverlandense]KAJ5820468.1 oxidoreductase [Penicillium riverlandense]